MRMDADVDLIRRVLRDEADPSVQVHLNARARLLGAITEGTGAELGSRDKRWRVPRVAVVCAVVAIVAFGIVSRLVPSSTQPTLAEQALQRAAAVVIPPASPQTILHVAATETLSPLARRADATTVASVSEDGWIQQGAPYLERTIVHPAGGPVLEEDSSAQIYNMTSNELYLPTPIPSRSPHYALLPGPTPGSFRLRVKAPHGYITTTVTAAAARSLRNGTAQVDWAVGWNGHVQWILPLVLPSQRQLELQSAQQPSGSSVSFAAELRALLLSGHARVTRTTTTDGKPAIEIASVNPQSGPRTIYFVNPKTYAPIELEWFGYDSPKDVTRLRFTAYQRLSLVGHQHLLRFIVPLTARIDHKRADYWYAAGLPKTF